MLSLFGKICDPFAERRSSQREVKAMEDDKKNLSDSQHDEFNNEAEITRTRAYPCSGEVKLFGKCSSENHHQLRTAKHQTKTGIRKNLFILCLGILLLFVSYEGLMNLQSTMNGKEGIGTTALAVNYAFFNLSSFFLPTLVIQRFGCKNTLIFSTMCFIPYIAANFYPRWGSLLPTAALCGMASGTLWSARSTYINEISFKYAELTQSLPECTAALFFGLGCMFYQGAQIWGNVISYYVLKPVNASSVLDQSVHTLASCGASFCDSGIISNDSNRNLDPPSDEKRITLTAIYVALATLAVFVFIAFLDRIETEKQKILSPKEKRLKGLLAACIQLKKRNQILLLPITMYFGVSDGFFFSTYTKAYVACAWGVYHVGFVMLAYGAFSSFVSALIGFMVKFFGRTVVFCSGAIVNMSMYAALLYWKPIPDERFVFFIIACAWGYGDAIWWSQVTALYGLLFKSEEAAAFSNFYFWNSTGFLLAYAAEEAFCTDTKLYVIAALLLLAMAGLFYLERSCITDKKSQDNREECNAQLQ